MTPPVSETITTHNLGLLTELQDASVEGRWNSVAQLPADAFAGHPERARVAALQSAALQHLGDHRAARRQALQALQWGLPREELGRTLIAAARHTLGRASLLARRDAQADKHFERAAPGVRMSSELRRIALARRDALEEDLRTATTTARALRARDAQPVAVHSPAWLSALVDRCVADADLHAAVDRAMEQDLTQDDDRLLFLMGVAEHLLSRGDRMSAIHFLNSGRWFCDGAEPRVRSELIRRLLVVGAPESAMDLAVRAGLGASGVKADLTPSLLDAYRKVREAAQSHTEHGHELLLAHLTEHIEALRRVAGQRTLVLVEIGTTREDVPGQGSTQKLAEFCLRKGLHFITVDMDPHNTRIAAQTFRRMGAGSFEAITAKGEDYLRGRTGPIDFAFLDAYDFDHGKHSELRQSRYERYLGSRIDEQACHRMHLDCAKSLQAKLWKHGVICIDDTWRQDSGWTAKGTLAMPYLLSSGFSLLDARNRAALLGRENPEQAAEVHG